MKTILIEPKYLQIIHDILKKNLPEQKVVAFGSRITNHCKPHSDLDLCVMGKIPLSFTKLDQLREDFSQSTLPFRVDIIDWATLTPEFRKIIQSNHIKI